MTAEVISSISSSTVFAIASLCALAIMSQPRRRKPNAEMRRREYLTDAEIDKLIEAAKGNRYGHRDATMVLVTYRYGLRAAELVDSKWDQIDFATATLAVRRVKKDHQRRIRSVGLNCARSEGCSGSKSLSRRLCSRRNVAHHSPLRDLHG
jgi:integrase